MPVSDKRPKKDGLEVSSQQLQDELVAIKDRLSAIETIQSVSNAPEVTKYVDAHLTGKYAKEIMQRCEEPRTRTELTTALSLNSAQALDHHLKPLRQANLLHQTVKEDNSIAFEWSDLFRALPRPTIKKILGIK
jgi:DNA-binding transcriptional ArsR family regulator